MSTRLRLLFWIALPLCGCSSVMVSPSVNGRAYVVRGSVFGTEVHNCELEDGQPVCYRVHEAVLPQ